MAGIVLSSAIRTNLLALQGTSDLQARVQERLATGKKVNSALDNATNFFTSASLTSRAADISGLLDSMGNAVQTIKAANTGIESIRKLVDNLQATARQALQAPSAFSSRATVAQSTALNNVSFSDLRGQNYTSAGVTGAARADGGGAITGASLINALTAGNAATAGDTLTVNGQTITVVASGASGNNQVNVGDSISTLLGKIDAITGTGTASAVAAGAVTLQTGTTSDLTIGGSLATKLGFTAGTTARNDAGQPLNNQTLTVTVGTGSAAQSTNITFSSSLKTLDDLNNALNAVGLTASLDSSGKLSLTTTNATASKSFLVQGAAATTLFGASSVASSNPVRGGTGATQRDSFLSDYNNLLKQVDTLAQDASFNGVNLLNGDDLSVIFNENNTSKLNIKGVIFNSTGLSLSTLTTADFNDSNAINAVLSKLDGASSSLRAQASKFGSNLSVVQTRQEFSKQLINTLQVGADNLTLADTNEEGANLLALNTRQQLSQTALSLASQASQAVLRLF
jgi:flagellin-like hook-associated protein FlgL